MNSPSDRVAICMCGALSLLFACGCGQSGGGDFVQRAEQLCLDQQYAEALPLLKEALLVSPNDAAAHYYLGRCYLEGEDFRPEMAEGEFQTALTLYLESGGKSPVARFSDDYFQLICSIDSGKAALLKVDSLMGAGASLGQVRKAIEEARGYVDEARKVDPEAEEVAAMDAFLGRLRIRRAESSPRNP